MHQTHSQQMHNRLRVPPFQHTYLSPHHRGMCSCDPQVEAERLLACRQELLMNQRQSYRQKFLQTQENLIRIGNAINDAIKIGVSADILVLLPIFIE